MKERTVPGEGEYMNQITVFADIIALSLLIVVLGGVYIQMNEVSKKKTAFIICILVDIFFAIVDLCVSVCIVNGIMVHNWIVMMLLLLSSYITTFVFLNFIQQILLEKGINNNKKIVVMKMYITALSAVVLFLGIIGDSIVISKNTIIAGTGQKICLLLLIIFYAIIFIFSIKNIHIIGKVDVLTLAAYLSVPTIVIILEVIFNELHLGQLSLGFSCLFMFASMARKAYNAHEEENLSYFKSIASSYATMHVIDLKGELISEFGAHDALRKYRAAHPERNEQDTIWGVLTQRICEAHKSEIMEFTRLDSLDERMKGIRKLSCEVLNVDDKWFRFSFVRVGEIDEKLERVIFTSHDVDHMRRSEETLKLISTTDELTKLNNRRAFQDDIDAIDKNGVPDDLWYLNIDLNGLKEINDAKGHSAGDELIVALGKTIAKAIYPWGKAYRIGGDEFVAIINTSKANIEVILRSLEEYRMQWSGKYSDTFSFSKGLVSSQEFPGASVQALAIEADKKMYIEKREYYISRGIERRK